MMTTMMMMMLVDSRSMLNDDSLHIVVVVVAFDYVRVVVAVVSAAEWEDFVVVVEQQRPLQLQPLYNKAKQTSHHSSHKLASTWEATNKRSRRQHHRPKLRLRLLHHSTHSSLYSYYYYYYCLQLINLNKSLLAVADASMPLISFNNFVALLFLDYSLIKIEKKSLIKLTFHLLKKLVLLEFGHGFLYKSLVFGLWSRWWSLSVPPRSTHDHQSEFSRSIPKDKRFSDCPSMREHVPTQFFWKFNFSKITKLFFCFYFFKKNTQIINK